LGLAHHGFIEIVNETGSITLEHRAHSKTRCKGDRLAGGHAAQVTVTHVRDSALSDKCSSPGDPKPNMHSKGRAVDEGERRFFRDELRAARAAALADAEGFSDVIRVIELLGQHLEKKARGLSDYKKRVSGVASQSPLFSTVPSCWPECHTSFSLLYDEMRRARNDAVHQGAYARTLTDHAVELSIILEDALMTDTSKVSQFMVRNVVQAEPWQPVSYVRQQMLRYAYSFLPIWHANSWALIAEYSLAQLLRDPGATATRAQVLAKSVAEIINGGTLRVLDARTATADTSLENVLQFICAQPILVVERGHPDVLAGLLTASDIL
jgi:predicted transcriptional regulator